jgi:endonuclease-8
VAGPGHQIRVWLATGEQQAVGLRIAMVEVLPTAAEDRLIGHLGPDILADRWEPAAAAARLAAAGDRPLVEALLDQSVVAGLGTIWAAETAFEARVSPWTPTSAALPALPDALAAIRRRMQASVAAPARAQQPRPAVYGRSGQPCRRCGTPIRAGRVGRPPTDRITYRCPSCQPGAGPR